MPSPTQPERIGILYERVAAIERRLEELAKPKRSDLRNGLIVAAIAAITLPVLWWGYTVTTNITAIKQQLADGGNKAIVAALRSPKSPQELTAALTTVVAQVQTAKADGKRGDPRKIAALADAVLGVVKANPSLEDGWRTAGSLVSFRSGSAPIQQMKPCDRTVRKIHQTGGPAPKDMSATINMSNCFLDLDQPNIWDTQQNASHILTPDELIPNWHLNLSGVVIHYSGGPLKYVSTISLDHCVFDLQVRQTPYPRGRSLIQDLLANSSPILNVDLSGITS